MKLEWKINMNLMKSRSTVFKKPKRVIGSGPGNRKKIKRIKAKPINAVINFLNEQQPPEPNDKTFKGLWGCDTLEKIEAHHAKWFKTFNSKALKALRKRVTPENRAMVEALLSRAGATSIPLLTSESICRESYKILHQGLVGVLNANANFEFALVTFISGDGGTSHFKTDIDLAKSQKRVVSTLRAMADHFFGIAELALFNSHGHPSGGQMVQRHEHACIWGPPGTVEKAASVAAKHTSRFQPNFSGAPVIDVRRVAANELNLARVAAYLFKPPYKCMNWNPGKNGKKGHMNGSEKGDRYTRYLRLAQIRTMLPFEKTMVAKGAGLSIRSQIMKFARSLAQRESANGRLVLHPDAIASFWIDLMPEILAARWNLPVIRLQHVSEGTNIVAAADDDWVIGETIDLSL